MKIVIFKGGLGNQLFQYVLYCQLKERFHTVKAINFCGDHNGFELDRWFDVDIDFCKMIFESLFWIVIRMPQRIRNKIVTDRFHYHEDGITLFFNDFWQSKKFFPSQQCVRFKSLAISGRNVQVLEEMGNTDSVAIHVRRGDYLNINLFTNLCETNYYTKAISFVSKKMTNPHFFFFSNDLDWCRKNYSLPNASYIDWNTGDDSIYDMYLMSKCKANIIANSTFSFWGAYLNEKSKFVIYPLNWYNGFKDDTLDIFPDEWIGM